jgi:hypothetical protein
MHLLLLGKVSRREDDAIREPKERLTAVISVAD